MTHEKTVYAPTDYTRATDTSAVIPFNPRHLRFKSLFYNIPLYGSLPKLHDKRCTAYRLNIFQHHSAVSPLPKRAHTKVLPKSFQSRSKFVSLETNKERLWNESGSNKHPEILLWEKRSQSKASTNSSMTRG